jgi:hypothetical protein
MPIQLERGNNHIWALITTVTSLRPPTVDIAKCRGAFDLIISRLRARFSHSTSTALRRFQHWRHLSFGSNSTREVTGGGIGRIGGSDKEPWGRC